MRALGRFFDRSIRAAWWALRQWSGDAAYENYLRSAARKAPAAGPPLLSQAEFYRQGLERKYSQVSRCC